MSRFELEFLMDKTSEIVEGTINSVLSTDDEVKDESVLTFRKAYMDWSIYGGAEEPDLGFRYIPGSTENINKTSSYVEEQLKEIREYPIQLIKDLSTPNPPLNNFETIWSDTKRLDSNREFRAKFYRDYIRNKYPVNVHWYDDADQYVRPIIPYNQKRPISFANSKTVESVCRSSDSNTSTSAAVFGVMPYFAKASRSDTSTSDENPCNVPSEVPSDEMFLTVEQPCIG
ncbi:uncharacterized protein LOC119671437 [Teleopsis dalmanni]|uniref:uncharacterized protein LOC119671437 n=1 Tax=Teleopsis dalmanni TaxID=139649 RepID=UPI0018CD02F8|nr:uncharacterized protein LOC119671437 [Teleopsis dalmanni]